jgi:hypothetical protein
MTTDIVKSKSLHEITNMLSNESLLLLDIDDTLIYHKYCCPNQWFRDTLKAGNFRTTKDGKFASYCSQDYLKIVTTYNHIISNVPCNYTHLTRDNLIFLFKKWNSICDVWGFTARGCEIARDTRRHLAHHGIEFKDRGRQPRRFRTQTGRAGLGSNQIIYCGGEDKGDMLRIFLTDRVWPPDRIVVVDDSLHNLESAQRMCKQLSIEFIGVLYEST